jgi:hypothetical protein
MIRTKYPYRQVFARFISSLELSETRRLFTSVAYHLFFTIDQSHVLKNPAGLQLNVIYQHMVQDQVCTLCLMGKKAAP